MSGEPILANRTRTLIVTIETNPIAGAALFGGGGASQHAA